MNINIIDQLPSVRGKLIKNAPLKNMTWLRVGGNAEILFQPKDQDDLLTFLKNCTYSKITIIGASSNLLIRDGGIDGIVIKLGRAFSSIKVNKTQIEAGCGAMDFNISKIAQKNLITGLEFLCGIPGTLGGAIKMNAGAHGSEIKDIISSITITDSKGNLKTINKDEMGFSYRKTNTPKDWFFLSAILNGNKGEKKIIDEKMKSIQNKRLDSQPIREKTAGSTFANPDGMKAWELIDKAGCRGLTIGDAMMSKHHCNFMINKGNATATDFESLGEEVRKRVKKNSGIDLRWEIKRIGNPI